MVAVWGGVSDKFNLFLGDILDEEGGSRRSRRYMCAELGVGLVGDWARPDTDMLHCCCLTRGGEEVRGTVCLSLA